MFVGHTCGKEFCRGGELEYYKSTVKLPHVISLALLKAFRCPPLCLSLWPLGLLTQSLRMLSDSVWGPQHRLPPIAVALRPVVLTMYLKSALT